MRARFQPEHPGAVAWVNGRMVRAGAVVDVDEATLARVSGLVAVDEGAEAAADFIAAISVPTPHNPEASPVADPAPLATPAKRGRKARGV